MERMHREDLRAHIATRLFTMNENITAESSVRAADALLAELERTAKPEPEPGCVMLPIPAGAIGIRYFLGGKEYEVGAPGAVKPEPPANGTVTVPILQGYDPKKAVGSVTIQRDAIPTEDHILAIGGKVTEKDSAGKIMAFDLTSFAPIPAIDHAAVHELRARAEKAEAERDRAIQDWKAVESQGAHALATLREHYDALEASLNAAQARVREVESNRCEHCGGKVTSYSHGCPGCGAPMCCQSCCDRANLEASEATLKARVRELEADMQRKLDLQWEAAKAVEAERDALMARLSAIDAAREGEPPEPDINGMSPVEALVVRRDWGRQGWDAAAERKVKIAALEAEVSALRVQVKELEERLGYPEGMACTLSTLRRDNAALRVDLDVIRRIALAQLVPTTEVSGSAEAAREAVAALRVEKSDLAGKFIKANEEIRDMKKTIADFKAIYEANQSSIERMSARLSRYEAIEGEVEEVPLRFRGGIVVPAISGSYEDDLLSYATRLRARLIGTLDQMESMKKVMTSGAHVSQATADAVRVIRMLHGALNRYVYQHAEAVVALAAAAPFLETSRG